MALVILLVLSIVLFIVEFFTKFELKIANKKITALMLLSFIGELMFLMFIISLVRSKM